MKKTRNINIFVDANIMIDYLLPRKFHTSNAISIFERATQFSAVLHVCSFSLNIAYHYMRTENVPHKIAMVKLEKMFQKVNILPVNNVVIQQALKSGFTDFEDAVQYFCALQVPECEAIITRNPNDFALSSVFVTTPQEFSSKYRAYKAPFHQ